MAMGGVMQGIAAIGDISSRNVEAGYKDSFSAVSDPASFLYYFKQAREDRRRSQRKEDQEMNLAERRQSMLEKQIQAQLSEFYRKQRWQKDFARALLRGNK